MARQYFHYAHLLGGEALDQVGGMQFMHTKGCCFQFERDGLCAVLERKPSLLPIQ